ncbi:MAG: acetyl-CoA carboxylase carboxyl transferase subunit alpha [Clostridia bacterium]|nr:acetyl-CoA carboxylase carboxyl transferase subunit alpha [Clostridia bacterium]
MSTAYEKLKIARASTRPTGSAYVDKIFKSHMELHGDRRFGDDAAIYSGVGFIDDGIPATFIAIDKGTDLQSRLARNFGCPKPEGYRKALRLMKQAEKFHRPVICFVDTLGAYPGAEAEQRGQGQAIAENILEMMGLKTPIISIITGEGGSGGALGLATADRVYMMENAVYSVISPEGCASILWKDSGKVADAAECLKITAKNMREFKVIEGIITEDFDHFDKMCNSIRHQIKKDIAALSAMSDDELLTARYERFRQFGYFTRTVDNN